MTELGLLCSKKHDLSVSPIIAYWLLYNVPHELRIKCCGPSNTQTASAPYLGIPNSLQIPWHWHLYQSGASATTCWQRYHCVPKHWAGSSNFTSFRKPSFDQWLSQADFIFLTLSTETLGYVKHAKLCCFPQSHIPPLSRNSHAMLTVIDIWDGLYSYWTVFTLVIVLLWLIFSQTTQVVTELHKIQNDTQFCVV